MTHRDDVAADLIVLEAERRSVPLYRFNTEDYPRSISVSYDPIRPETVVLGTHEGAVELGKASGIWIRRPRWPEIASEVADPVDRQFARQEAVAAIGGAWRILAAKCVSPPDAMQAARWKIPQLEVAAHLGMLVPETLVTSDPIVARSFLSAGPTIVKAVAQGHVRLGDEERAGGTRAIDDVFDDRTVKPAPVLLQRRVAKVADVRITVVGRQLFPVRITTPEGAPLDFRETDPTECGYEVVSLAPIVSSSLAAYLDAWGLRFGAFDFAEDRDGRLWFLECNPAGQWGWLEPPTGLDITGALLELLLDPQAA